MPTAASIQPLGNVSVSIKVNGQPARDWPRKFELHQEWGKHDMLKLSIVVPLYHPYQSRLAAWPDNSPVEITWGRLSPRTISTWYGYVNHSDLLSTAEDGRRAIQLNYHLIGTSKPMNTAVNKTWLNMTADTIAQQIARKWKLRCVYTVSSWTLDYEVQAGESDFSFLSRLAQKTGYRFLVSGGTLYFVDPLMMLSAASTYFVWDYVIDGGIGYRDTAKDFRRLAGDNLPGAVAATRQIWYVDASTRQPALAQAGPQLPVTIQRTDKFARSRSEAQNMLQAVQSLAQFQVGCTVDVLGNTLLYPGKVFRLTGHALPDSAAGYYLVTAATHRIFASGLDDTTKDLYWTSLTGLKNSESYIPAYKGIQKISPEIVTCILAGGQWQASAQNAIREGSA
jgi:hypothetical protein